MRNIAEISKDLSAKVAATKAMDRKADEAAFRAAMDEVNALTQELNDARSIEAAEQAAAARQLQDLEKKENRRFSITKFLREAAEGQLSGLEAEVAEMGAKEYERQGLSRKGFVVPMVALRSSAGQNYTTDADGGYAKETAAPTYLEGLKDRLVVNKLGAHVLGDLVGTVPFVSAGAISASWLAEGATASVSKSTFAKVSLTPHRNAVIGAFSKDLLRQTSIDIDSIVWDKIQQAHAELLEAACIAGTGSNNQPTGILTSVTATAGNTTANAQTVHFDNIYKLYYSLKAPYRRKASFLCNETLLLQLMLLKDLNGNYIWKPGLDVAKPDTILGRPIYTSSYMPAITGNATADKNKKVLLFGDFNYYWIADRKARTLKRLNELYAVTDQVGFIGTQRVDGKLILPEAMQVMALGTGAASGG